MSAHVPTATKGRAIVEVMTRGETKETIAAIAARHGVTPSAIASWRKALDEGDEELRLAVAGALRTALQGWRPKVASLIVRLVEHVEQLLEDPKSLDAETAIGAIRALAGVLGQVDLLAKRHGLDDEPEPPKNGSAAA